MHRRLGEALLLDALRRIVDAAGLVGCTGIIVDAKDDGAERFYANYDYDFVTARMLGASTQPIGSGSPAGPSSFEGSIARRTAIARLGALAARRRVVLAWPSSWRGGGECRARSPESAFNAAAQRAQHRGRWTAGADRARSGIEDTRDVLLASKPCKRRRDDAVFPLGDQLRELTTRHPLRQPLAQVLISRHLPTDATREACVRDAQMEPGVPVGVDHHHAARLTSREQDAREVTIELVERDSPLLRPLVLAFAMLNPSLAPDDPA